MTFQGFASPRRVTPTPLLYADTLPLHWSGDDLKGKLAPHAVLRGGLALTDITWLTDQKYDKYVASFAPGSSGVGWDYPLPGGDGTAILTMHGQNVVDNMFGLYIVDASGNGIGVSGYNNPQSTFAWILGGRAYSSTGNQINGVLPWVFGTQGVPFCYRIVKSGSNYTVGISGDGGVTWFNASAHSLGNTMVRYGVGRMFSNSTGTHRVGRVNWIPA